MILKALHIALVNDAIAARRYKMLSKLIMAQYSL
jgi:hypothetical protein